MSDAKGLAGVSTIAGERGAMGGREFWAVNPRNGEGLSPAFVSASPAEADAAMRAAEEAFAVYGKTSGAVRAALLRAIAARIEGASEAIVERAHLETALPQPRLAGEVVRTSNQLRLFANLVEEGSWVAAHIDTALPDRKPLPRPELRSMLLPIGPVVVFGASNFPVAFSTAGGDTASALAAGCPVVVKAHPAHPGTGEIVAEAICAAVAEAGLPAGVFSHLYDAGTEIGAALVQHEATKAVAFTGSHKVGRLLMDLAAKRETPVPCFAEMSSANPVFVLPGAFDRGAETVAAALHQSFTLGAGQFCTKPGIVFLPELGESARFVAELERLVAESQSFTMLTPQIAENYERGLSERVAEAEASTCARKPEGTGVPAALLQTGVEAFLRHPEMGDELFGPCSLLVHVEEREAMLAAARGLEGHLTATILGSEADLAANRDLIAVLERKVGRLIFNGYPTGVEVSSAMIHGGPYPATSDSRFTSVGSQAILRFARPVCYQNYPDALLPAELQNANPIGIVRLVDGVSTRDALGNVSVPG
jgi:NADP-dependent aldehyde dehydrogenase